MSLVVVGSIAFDAIKSPFGERERALGGSAVHFSLASSFLAPTRLVGPVGDDFGEDEYAVLHDRGVITDDVEHVPGGKTFFWHGEYHFDLNSRTTHDTQLNVFETFQPKLSPPSLEPPPGGAVVKVEAAALNFPDLLSIAGQYQADAAG